MANVEPLLQDESALEKLIETIQRCAQSKIVNVEATSTFDRAAALARIYGLSNDSIISLVKLIQQPKHLRRGHVTRLASIIYPREKISDDIVWSIVSCLDMGRGHVNLRSQKILLRWLIDSSPFLANSKVLIDCYAVLFLQLGCVTIRPEICSLLFLASNHTTIVPWRAEYLADLFSRNHDDRDLFSLLLVYQDYFPQINAGRIGFTKPKPLDVINEDYNSTVHKIQSRNAQNGIVLSSGFINEVRGRKKRRRSGIPRFTSKGTDTSLVSVEDIHSIQQYVENVEKLVLPIQIGMGFLQNPTFLRLLIYMQDEASWTRVNVSMGSVLEDIYHVLVSSGTNSKLTTKQVKTINLTLGVALDISKYTKTLLPCVQYFLARYMEFWDGDICRDLIIKLLCFWSVEEWSEFRDVVIIPLHRLATKKALDFKLDVLRFSTELLQRWWAIGKDDLQTGEGDLAGIIISSSRPIAHLADTISDLAFLPNYWDVETQSVIGNFCSLIARFPGKNKLTLPSFDFVYLTFLGSNIFSLVECCEILNTYRSEITESAKISNDEDSKVKEEFNAFIMDICNALWRNKAFDCSTQPARGFQISSKLMPSLQALARKRGLRLDSIFGLTEFWILASMSMKYTQSIMQRKEYVGTSDKDTESNSCVVVTPASLEKLRNQGLVGDVSFQQYREGFVQYIWFKGLVGVSDFLVQSVGTLQKSTN